MRCERFMCQMRPAWRGRFYLGVRPWHVAKSLTVFEHSSTIDRLMDIKSLGYKSELIFTDFDGRVDDRGSYLAMHTLTNPNYFWGNLLIFNQPPKRGDMARWISLFKKEFTDPRIYHMTFAWDSTDVGDASEFIESGYDYQLQSVLTCRSVVKPPHFNSELEVRPLRNDHEWAEMVELQTRSADEKLPTDEWRKFYVSQARRYRAMAKAGMGHWYGGFLGQRQVAGLGIFHREDLGRFQIVCTDPEYRRQGICGTLVYESSMQILAEGKVRDLVMCADPSYHAIKIYESVGFKRADVEHGVSWWDRSRRGF